MNPKEIIKKFIPSWGLSLYHKALALAAAFLYRNPSNKLVVIGVTGTNGKTTTANIIANILEQSGKKVGLTTTVNFKVADREWLNDKKMTMVGRFQLQKLLKEMVDVGCEYAVIETSSQGIEQFRHLGINYDVAVFTNLTPEHIEAHGGFENYKKAKGKLFSHLTDRRVKVIKGEKIAKTIVVNADDKYADYFLCFGADKKVTYSLRNSSDYQGTEVNCTAQKSQFKVLSKSVTMKLLGEFNVMNALAGIATVRQFGVDLDDIRSAFLHISGVPGRMEVIDEGQPYTVIVDYAPEPESMKKLYETVKLFEVNKVIHVFGSCGGGRDVARRPVLGRMVGEHADIAIVTNEDPYDDDPQKIIDQVVAGTREVGKTLNADLFTFLDRKEAIEKALSLAEPGDLVLVTGKGAEQAMAVAGGKHIKWDDREVIRQLLNA